MRRCEKLSQILSSASTSCPFPSVSQTRRPLQHTHSQEKGFFRFGSQMQLTSVFPLLSTSVFFSSRTAPVRVYRPTNSTYTVPPGAVAQVTRPGPSAKAAGTQDGVARQSLSFLRRVTTKSVEESRAKVWLNDFIRAPKPSRPRAK